jgi:SAM-dependent methyltransferase
LQCLQSSGESENFHYPYDDGFFDLVLSDQVIEHVADLDGFIAEISRVSGPTATGLHIYPAQWTPVEVHMKIPLAHWFPKGRSRRQVIHLALRVGLAESHFASLSLNDRTDIFERFSNEQTFYRRMSQVVTTFRRYGLHTEPRASARDRVRFQHPDWSVAATDVVGLAYRHLKTVVLLTSRARG